MPRINLVNTLRLGLFVFAASYLTAIILMLTEMNRIFVEVEKSIGVEASESWGFVAISFGLSAIIILLGFVFSEGVKIQSRSKKTCICREDA